MREGNGNNDDWLATYDRQAGEGDQRWEAFQAYRDQDHRSLRKVADALDKSFTIIGRWSRENDWVQRVEDWERDRDRARQKAFLAEHKDIGRKQAADAAALQEALIAPAKALAQQLQDAVASEEDPFEDWDLRELQHAASASAKAWIQVATFERLVRGLATEPTPPEEILRREIEGKSRDELVEFLAKIEHGRGMQPDDGA